MVRPTPQEINQEALLSRQMSFNSSDSDSLPFSLFCFKSRMAIFIFMSILIAYILFLPLFFLVLYLGVQQRRRRRSRPTAATTSHSDFFTYNVVGLELICVLASCLYCFGVYNQCETLLLTAVCICTVTSSGQTLFHVLTCVERYLAVVRPIAYLALKRAGGLRIRNVSAVCVWLLCIGDMGLSKLFSISFALVANSCILPFSLILVSFCSISVLRVLTHPGPGQRERVDQSKQRAFYAIVAILVAQLFRFVGGLVSNVLLNLNELTKCAIGTAAIWFTLPCSLVLPLLFLQRAGKLPGGKCNAKSG